MTNQPSHRVADLLLGFEGLAIMRNFWMHPEVVRERVEEASTLLESRKSDPELSESSLVDEAGVVGGYDRWATTYDQPGNPVVGADERLLRPLLDRLEGRLADVACGTARHALYLKSQAKEVAGFDRSLGMLRGARAKDPNLPLSQADISALPIPNESLDGLVCSLALTHLRDIGPAIREFGRVVRPGGTIVISDVHPTTIATGAHGSFKDAAGEFGVIRNHLHLHSSYMLAFRDHGLKILDCLEACWTIEDLVPMELERFPELMRTSILGLPLILAWIVEVR